MSNRLNKTDGGDSTATGRKKKENVSDGRLNFCGEWENKEWNPILKKCVTFFKEGID